MPSKYVVPADRQRQIEIIPSLIALVVALKDNVNYPLHKDRVVRYMIDRWSSAEAFTALDELCGIDGVGQSMFPDIQPITLFGDDFANDDILHVEIEWLGTDAVKLVITYHLEAHARMVKERDEALQKARELRAATYPALDAVLAAYKALKRTAWVPVLHEGEGDGLGSRYFGSPWMPHDAIWPTNSDGGALTFIMQIDIRSLPGLMKERVGNEGLLAMFYDTKEFDPSYEGPEDYETDAVFIKFDTDKDGGLRDGKIVDLTPKRVVQWRSVGDYPDFSDMVVGTDVPVAIQKFLMENTLDIGGSIYRMHGEPPDQNAVQEFMQDAEAVWGADACDAETAGDAVDMFCGDGDKLGGWPSWDAERHWLSKDGRRMEFFFQLDLMSPHWKGFAFWRGDERGHVFYDPSDGGVFRLAWNT